MPLIDIAISHPCSCFRNNILAFSSETHFHNKLVIGNGKRLGLASSFSWKTIISTEKLTKHYKPHFDGTDVFRRGLMVKAVATIEMSSVSRKHQNVLSRMDIDSVRSNGQVSVPQSSSEDSTQVAEREKLRRMRISKANKGNTPWNKGRKHSPETLRRIKERTKLAMQDPKVKMKLINLGHAQSDETRMKIGLGVRLGWERRREKLMVQETCHYEWQNLIAVAARKGHSGEEELQWDSYKVLDEQLEKEWLESVEQRKKAQRPKGSKRAPKSAEQRKKIAAAIAAKWADPNYRDRVCSGLAKFHGISEMTVRKPKKKPTGEGQTRKSTKNKGEAENPAKLDNESPSQRIRLKRSKTPRYKDPLASSKLELLKNIRAQRAGPINRKTEAITRAKLLIAEAEKAATALETAAQNSHLAQTSLMESRMLISEAIQFIESIEEENEDALSFEHHDYDRPLELRDLSNDGAKVYKDIVHHKEVNSFHSPSANGINGFIFDKFVSDETNELYEPVEELEGTSNGFILAELNHSTISFAELEINRNGSTRKVETPSVNGMKVNGNGEPKNASVMKKWVRGRLVEVEEEEA